MDTSKAVSSISSEAVQAALTADQGPEATLDTWENVPFTKMGDNYCSIVTSIKVKFKKSNKCGEISYVVKINSCEPFVGVVENQYYAPPMFEKEGKFYLEILPELNKLMNESGQKSLPFPKCYYAQYAENKEIIIYEDLHLKDFKMTDRCKGMDIQHATLVIQGLGLLHASSSVMLERSSMEEFRSRYPFVFNEMWKDKIVDVLITPNVTSGKNLLMKVGGHENAVNWIDKQIPKLHEFLKMSYSSSPPFNVICHGDCWTNNILFRYDESGMPVEVRLLDLQVNRVASLATDLKHFLFASMEGPVRKPNVDHLLTEYYKAFSTVVESCGHNLPFTKEELIQEYKNKNDYGIIFGILYVPPLLVSATNTTEMEVTGLESEKLDKDEKDFYQKAMDSLGTNPAFKPRFLDMFDEMAEEGLFD